MKKIDRLSGYFDVAKETMPVENLREYYDINIKDIVNHAYKNAPAINKIMKEAGLLPEDIQNSDDLCKLPVLKKNELKKYQEKDPPFGGFLTQPFKSLQRIYISPGPIYDPHSEPVVNTMAQVFYNCGFRAGDIVLNTWSYHLVPAGCLLDEAIRSIGAVVIPAGVGHTDLQVVNMKNLKVTGFVGTSGFLMTVINKAEAMGYDFKRDLYLEVALAGGEMGGGPMRDLFENKYGLITSDAYGTADTGLLAYECRERTGMHFVTGAFIEIVNPETRERLGPGEIGEIVATPFNHMYPLIRFGTGDLGMYRNTPCSCGRTTPKIEKIVGRIGDAVRIRGLFIHRSQLELVLKSFPEVSKYQVIIERKNYRDKTLMQLELNKIEDIDINESEMKERLQKRFQEICTIKMDEIQIVNKILFSDEKDIFKDLRVY